jgi:AcrR family transcriptional regulator
VKQLKRTQPRRTRAVDENSKQQRRACLLSAATRLFAERDYEDVMMVEIAAAAGLAKGTVYLYFSTKEALFLELVNEQLSAWTTQLTDALKREEPDRSRIAVAFASTLAERPVLIRLLALLHIVLERNIDANLMRTFKHQLLGLMAPPAQALENLLGLSSGSGVQVLLWVHAVIVGLSQMANPSPVLTKVLHEDEALKVFRMDFRSELEAALAALFAGVSQ